MKLDQAKLMGAVNRHRRKSAMTWNEVKNEFGYSSDSTIHKLRTSRNMSANKMIQMMLWMGIYDIRTFLKEGR